MGCVIITFGVVAGLVGCAPVQERDRVSSMPSVSDATLVDLTSHRVLISGYGQYRFFTMPASNLFYQQSAQIYQKSFSLLDHLVDVIRVSPHHVVSVSIVYADSPPNRRKHGLWVQQAQAVASYLWDKGVDARYISTTAKAVGRNDNLFFWRNYSGEDAFVQVRTG